MEEGRGMRFFSSFAHVMSAVAATAATHACPAPASVARSRGPSRRSTSARGLTLVHVSAQREDLLFDTLRQEMGQPRMEQEEETETKTARGGMAGWGLGGRG